MWKACQAMTRQAIKIRGSNMSHFHPVAAIREWRRRARGRRELAGLNEMMLHDIGITRADAEFLSRKPSRQIAGGDGNLAGAAADPRRSGLPDLPGILTNRRNRR
jgi:uncharacterized protein YjiS (DUF1127 family)